MAETLFTSLEMICDYVMEYAAAVDLDKLGYIEYAPLQLLDVSLGRYCREIRLTDPGGVSTAETVIQQVLVQTGSMCDDQPKLAMIECSVTECQHNQKQTLTGAEFNQNPAWLAQLEALLEPLLAKMRQHPDYGRRLAGLESRLTAGEWAEFLDYLEVVFQQREDGPSLPVDHLKCALDPATELEVLRIAKDPNKPEYQFSINRMMLWHTTLMMNRPLVKHIRQLLAERHRCGRQAIDRRHARHTELMREMLDAQFAIINTLKL